jgi:hypothetical protein
VFHVGVSPRSRCSDHEVYKPYPDYIEEFPVEEALKVYVLPSWHFDGNHEDSNIDHHLDIMLVLRPVNEDDWALHYDKDTLLLENLEDELTMLRIGLLEMTYGLDQQGDLCRPRGRLMVHAHRSAMRTGGS